MSFFGALFAGVTLLSKGIAKGQNAVEDHELKKRSQQLGKDTYYDHDGILHDSVTGRAITYYKDPVTGHKLIQDAYTLNTIRDLTAEERRKEIEENKQKAKEVGEEFYEVGKPMDVLGRKIWMKYERKYGWNVGCSMRKAITNAYGNYTGKSTYHLDDLKYGKNAPNQYTRIYKKEKEINTYIKEKISNNIYVYTDLESGMAISIDSRSKEELKELNIDSIDFINKINDEKLKYAKNHFNEIPMSTKL